MNHEYSRKRQMVRLNGFLGSPKVREGGKPKGFVVLYKERKVRENGGLFP